MRSLLLLAMIGVWWIPTGNAEDVLYQSAAFTLTSEANDFRGVYIACGTPPLSWDFGNLPRLPGYRLTDPDGDGIHAATLRFCVKPYRLFDESGNVIWKLSENLSGLPRYESSHRHVDALYNLSLEELVQDRRPDGALMAAQGRGSGRAMSATAQCCRSLRSIREPAGPA